MLVRQRVTDPTSGFQALNRHAIGLFAARLPARLPGGRGDRDGFRHRLRADRGAGDDARARARPSSITALRSIYYMIKVLLAIFVGLFRRNVVLVEE